MTKINTTKGAALRLTIALILFVAGFSAQAQVYTALPSGAVPYSSQIYRKISGSDTTYYTGASGKGFVKLGGYADVLRLQDSIADLRADKVDKVTGKSLLADSEITRLLTVATGATANSTDAQLRDRSTHTGTQGMATVIGLPDSIADLRADKVDKVSGKQLSTEDFTTAEKTKLSGIAAGATANSTDAQLRDRSTHTGTQAISTVSGLQASLDGKVDKTTSVNGHALSGNVTVTKTDVGLGNVPDVDATNAGNITSGTLPDGRLSGNVTMQGNAFNSALQLLKLDAGGKVPMGNLPATLMIYIGMWDLSTNTPALSDGTSTAGYVYRVTGAPSTTNFDFGSGNIALTNNDYVIYNAAGKWEKSDGTDQVTSVNGQQGIVTLTKADVGLASVEDKSSATIRSELTSLNVTTALGYMPYNSSNPAGYISSFTETDPGVPAYAKTLSSFGVIQSSTDALYKPIGYQPAWGDITGTVPTWNQNTTGNAATSDLADNSTLWNGKTFGGVGSVFDYLLAYRSDANIAYQVSAANVNTFLGGPFLPIVAGPGNSLTGRLFGIGGEFTKTGGADYTVYDESGRGVRLASPGSDFGYVGKVGPVTNHEFRVETGDVNGLTFGPKSGGNWLAFSSSGTATFGNYVDIATGVSFPGAITDRARMYYSPSIGAILYGAGSQNDFTFLNKNGQGVIANPTGTQNLVVEGNVGIGTTSPAYRLQVGSSSIANESGGNTIGVSGSSFTAAATLSLEQVWNGLVYPASISNVPSTTGGASSELVFKTSRYLSGVVTSEVMRLTYDAGVKIVSLAGTGNRITYANASGTLGSMVIGSGLSFDGTTLSTTETWNGQIYTGETNANPTGELIAFDGTNNDWRPTTKAQLGFSAVASSGAYADLSGRPTSLSSFTNDPGFITGITSGNVTTALGYTPYNATNPSGFITSAALANYVNTTGDQSNISGNKGWAGFHTFGGVSTSFVRMDAFNSATPVVSDATYGSLQTYDDGSLEFITKTSLGKRLKMNFGASSNISFQDGMGTVAFLSDITSSALPATGWNNKQVLFGNSSGGVSQSSNLTFDSSSGDLILVGKLDATSIITGNVDTNSDVEVLQSANGIILHDSNDVRYRVTVNTSGALVVTAL